jgi:hypothetical protein
MHARANKHTQTHTHTHMLTHAHMLTHIHAHKYIHTYKHATYINAYIHACTHPSSCIFLVCVQKQSCVQNFETQVHHNDLHVSACRARSTKCSAHTVGVYKCTYVLQHMYTYTFVHAYIHTSIHIHAHTFSIHTAFMHEYILVNTHTHTYVYTHTHTYVYTFIHTAPLLRTESLRPKLLFFATNTGHQVPTTCSSVTVFLCLLSKNPAMYVSSYILAFTRQYCILCLKKSLKHFLARGGLLMKKKKLQRHVQTSCATSWIPLPLHLDERA